MKGTGRYTCKECRGQLGYLHYPSCSLPGVVISTQCDRAEEAKPLQVQPYPLCKCNHRYDAHGENAKGPTACHQESCPCMEYRPMNHDDEVKARTDDDTLHLRAAKIARELSAEGPKPDANVLVVRMPTDAPTTSESVLGSVRGSADRVAAAEVVIGVWPNGHMHIGKNRFGPDGPVEPEAPAGAGELEGRKEWPRKLIWGCWVDESGAIGVAVHIQDVPVRPGVDVEPYIPTRNVLGALEALRNDTQRGVNRHGPLPELEARIQALNEATELIENETWSKGD